MVMRNMKQSREEGWWVSHEGAGPKAFKSLNSSLSKLVIVFGTTFCCKENLPPSLHKLASLLRYTHPLELFADKLAFAGSQILPRKPPAFGVPNVLGFYQQLWRKQRIASLLDGADPTRNVKGVMPNFLQLGGSPAQEPNAVVAWFVGSVLAGMAGSGGRRRVVQVAVPFKGQPAGARVTPEDHGVRSI